MRHSEINDKILILIITPTRSESYGTERNLCGDRNELNCVCFHADGIVEDAKHPVCDKCELVLIDQCQDENVIKEIITSFSQLNKNLLVWSHGTEVSNYGPISDWDIEDWIGDNRIVNDGLAFHHYSDCDAEKLMEAYLQKNRAMVTDILTKYFTKREATNIHELRSKVLTPLVALDLLLQARISPQEWPKEIKTTLYSEEYDANVRRLLDNISADDNFISKCVNLVAGAKNDAKMDPAMLRDMARSIEIRITKLEI